MAVWALPIGSNSSEICRKGRPVLPDVFFMAIYGDGIGNYLDRKEKFLCRFYMRTPAGTDGWNPL